MLPEQEIRTQAAVVLSKLTSVQLLLKPVLGKHPTLDRANKEVESALTDLAIFLYEPDQKVLVAKPDL